MNYNREQILKDHFNNFLREKIFLPERDYFSKLSLEDFLELKSVLKEINDIITLKLTLKFVNWLKNYFTIDEQTYQEIFNKIKSIKPNSNGFDVQIDDVPKLIAEVKCNIPITKGETYGSAQRDGIIADLKSLINGKKKSKINVKDYYKFMVLYDNEKVRIATENLVKLLASELKNNIQYFSEKRISKEKVNIIYLK